VTALLHKLRPIAQRWGGGPRNEDCVVEGFGADPSTMLRMVPLPTGCAGREERK
jgi:hypothetical protein